MIDSSEITHKHSVRKGDLFMGKANESAIVTLVGRSSRFLIAFRFRQGTGLK
jgi:IS30 family transposase